MGLADVTRDAVLEAIREYDELGGELFLRTYGFEGSRSYFLVHEGRRYDSKALCGVAHKHVQGRPSAPVRVLRWCGHCREEAGEPGVRGPIVPTASLALG